MPLALTDAQLKTVMEFAAAITPEKRSTFLERVGAMLVLRGRFNDADVSQAPIFGHDRVARYGNSHPMLKFGLIFKCKFPLGLERKAL